MTDTDPNIALWRFSIISPLLHRSDDDPALLRQLDELGKKYVEGLHARSPESLKITDKMPGNFHYVGLIKLMLPNAKIVHISRHPLVLSIRSGTLVPAARSSSRRACSA